MHMSMACACACACGVPVCVCSKHHKFPDSSRPIDLVVGVIIACIRPSIQYHCSRVLSRLWGYACARVCVCNLNTRILFVYFIAFFLALWRKCEAQYKIDILLYISFISLSVCARVRGKCFLSSPVKLYRRARGFTRAYAIIKHTYEHTHTHAIPYKCCPRTRHQYCVTSHTHTHDIPVAVDDETLLSTMR